MDIEINKVNNIRIKERRHVAFPSDTWGMSCSLLKFPRISFAVWSIISVTTDEYSDLKTVGENKRGYHTYERFRE
jgi:hypothetical protein